VLKNSQIVIIFIAAFIATILFYIEWRRPGTFLVYDISRDVPDRDYITKSNCPEELDWFNYCRKKGTNELKNNLVILGDSLALPFSEYLEKIGVDHLYLGAGSCPMLKGIVATYSNSNCLDQNSEVYGPVKKVLPWSSENLNFVFIHSAAYISTFSLATYRSAIIESMAAFQLLQPTTRMTFTFVFPVARPEDDLAMCLPRKFQLDRNCKLQLRSDQKAQSRLFDELMLKGIHPLEIEFSRSLLEYKDDLHLSVLGVEVIYGPNILNWLENINKIESSSI
jgi:hypothetical protein